MRKATSLLLAVTVAASLAACSGGGTSPTTAACATTGAGDLSAAVTVKGDFGKKPDVTFTTPVVAKETQRTVVITGDGDVALEGDTVNVQFSLYGGATAGDPVSTGWTDAGLAPIPLDATKIPAGIVKTLKCSTVGSRVVGVIPPADGFGDQGSSQLGVKAGDSIVFVADVVSIKAAAAPALPKANGVEQTPTPGFPTVVLADSGQPTVTIPDGPPPTDLKIALLKKGDGATVANGANVVVHYQGINWNTKKVFDESWARGTPATFNTGGVIPGFTAALVGQNVGSQVIVIIPPDQGYGAKGSPPDIGGTDTLVFVIDILGIA